MGYFDFQTLASRFYPNTTLTTLDPNSFSMTRFVFDWFRYLYGRQYPLAPLRMAQFTMLRHPEQRLSSMYYYDRTAARQAPWRKEFVALKGNLTWNQCWDDEDCWTRNDFSKWCNLQTELLCGTDCERGDSELALSKAKATVSSMAAVGITERFDESLQLLSVVFPTFLPPLALETALQYDQPLPRKKTSSVDRRERILSQDEARDRLNHVCRFDLELYDFATALLTQRLSDCGVVAAQPQPHSSS